MDSPNLYFTNTLQYSIVTFRHYYYIPITLIKRLLA